MKFKRVVAAKVEDIQEDRIEKISVDNKQILLAKVDNKFYATTAFCTHAGAPLEEGILHHKRIVCPWHNACFNIVNGEIEEPPGRDNLASFTVKVEGDRVIVELPENFPLQRTPHMAKKEPNNNKIFVILGSGTAGSIAAETLRKEGFSGRIILISKEKQLPYDRTQLSKEYLKGKSAGESLPLRKCQFYQENEIELWFDRVVTKVDAKAKKVTFADNCTLNYDALLLATGTKAKKLDIVGADLNNIFTIRDRQDAEKLKQAAERAKKAVIIGSGFIGTEAAASLKDLGLDVTIVSPDSVPFEKILGQEIGTKFKQLHQENGVSFCDRIKATKFEGKDTVEAVILEDGTRLEADLVVVAIGVEPATEYLSGVEIAEDNSIVVNEHLQVADGLYAAGDIASFPYPPLETKIRIEHWRVAAQHGIIAARNMIKEKSVKFDKIPFFWTAQFGTYLQYTGHAEDWDEIIYQGDLETRNFLAFYIKDNRILAVAGCDRDKDIAAISELMREDNLPQVEAIRRSQIDWIYRLKQSAKKITVTG
ncbi:MAG: FAD-dependent oxidoreductase [Prochloraceae cyanobacterium]